MSLANQNNKDNTNEYSRMDAYLDDIDRHIIYRLMDDARNTTATMIAEELEVTDGTIRNRIERLEEEGVIRGYTAMIDFEKAEHMKAVFICTAPGAERERLALAIQSIPGVIHVRVLMLGRPDLQVVAAGKDTKDLRQIADALSELDIEIEDEELVQTEIHSPYNPFGPGSSDEPSGVDRIELVGKEDLLEITVTPDAPITGRTVGDLRSENVFGTDATLISVEQGNQVLSPTETTELQRGDRLTILPRAASEDEIISTLLADRS